MVGNYDFQKEDNIYEEAAPLREEGQQKEAVFPEKEESLAIFILFN